MAENKLITILPPPDSPSESGAGIGWSLIEDKLTFPSDYINFIDKYGSGRIADFIVIFNPFSKNENINFYTQYKLIREDFIYLIESDASYYKYNFYPGDNGLIPLGVTDNGDYLFWIVNSRNDSNLWKTAIVPARSSEVEYFEIGLTKLLENLLEGNIKPKSFPDNFPPKIITFKVI